MEGERYVLGALLGRGGMGSVFRAFDRLLERDVAVKVLAPSFAEHRDAVRRLKREGEATTRLAHPHIVSTFDVDVTHEDGPRLIMEWVDGAPLDRVLENGRLPLAQAVDLAAQLADGLSAVHALGLEHRDIKPSNLLLEAQTGRLKIADFGLVRAPEEPGITCTEMILGTPEYMAPERFLHRDPGPEADVYALGAVLFEMLTGDVVISGSPMEIALTHGRGEFRVPALPEDLPEELGKFINRCLSATKAERPTAEEAFAWLSDHRENHRLEQTQELSAVCVVGDAQVEHLRVAAEGFRVEFAQAIGRDLVMVFDAAEACLRFVRQERERDVSFRAAIGFGGVVGRGLGVVAGRATMQAARLLRLAPPGEVLLAREAHDAVGLGYRSFLAPAGTAHFVGGGGAPTVYRLRESEPLVAEAAVHEDSFECPLCGHASHCGAMSAPAHVACSACGSAIGLAQSASSSGRETLRDHLLQDRNEDRLLADLGAI